LGCETLLVVGQVHFFGENKSVGVIGVMANIVNTSRGIVAVGFGLISAWYGILCVIWNIGFFDNFAPGIVAVFLGIILIEALPIIFIVSWVLYGFDSVTPLLIIMIVSVVTMWLGYFFMPKGE